ncbi:MAG: nickel pincer cofactor biosynthesis protein LarB [Pirellulales bacterium]|nr:nickel pincer cofactor biosynthesis protein LarB [Pirellulales bacterium]
MNSRLLVELAAQLSAGELAPDEFLRRLHRADVADLDEAQLDLDRPRRCGFPEVVFAEGKTVAVLQKIFRALLDSGADVLATRLSAEQAAVLLPQFPQARHNPVGRTLHIGSKAGGQTFPSDSKEDESRNNPEEKIHGGKVVIVTAGTSDLPVAEEARETALWTGARVTLVPDVGVAGPHRLRANLPLLEDADAVVVVAGMEGALPSVVGGYVGCPIIAVPTSVGYGASFGGVAALLAMLNSCAANVTVVNIDAGFKGGYVAGLIARNAARAREKQSKPFAASQECTTAIGMTTEK